MCEDIRIELMTAEDVDQVWEIERGTFPVPWSRRSIESEVTSNQCARYLLLKRENEVLGYAGMWLVLDEAHITNVAVRAGHRGRGLGERLMRALIQLAADSGMNWMTLECRVSNAAARGLYGKLGFIEVGRRRGYYEDNGEDAVLMALEDLPEGDPERDPFAVEDLTDMPGCDKMSDGNSDRSETDDI